MALGTVGRFMYAVPFAVFGLFHLMNGAAMAPMVPVPGGVFWIYLTGLAMIAAAVSIVSGKQAALATLLLGIMLLIFVVLIHVPTIVQASDAAEMQAPMSQLLKDVALAGGAWVLHGRYASRAAGPQAP